MKQLRFVLVFGVCCSAALYAQRGGDLRATAANPIDLLAAVPQSPGQASFYSAGMHLDGTRHDFPFFQETKVVSNLVPALKLTNITVRELSNAEVSQISAYKNEISAEFEVRSYVSRSRETTTAYYQVAALRLNAFTNKYELLTAYTPEWDQAQGKTLATGATHKTTASTYVSNSVLASGKWYKIGLSKTGVYKIDKTLLEKIGISTTGLDPRQLRIYGNGGKLMPERNSAFKYDDLTENAIVVQGEGDGTFDAGDYILFYGQSTDRWKKQAGSCLRFDRQQHYFSDTSFYYITADLGPGKRIADQPSLSQPPAKTSNSYDYYDYHEQNLVNVVRSGREFYGEKMDFTTSYTFPFAIADAVIGDSVYVKGGGLSRSGQQSVYSINYAAASMTYSCAATNITDTNADWGYDGYTCSGSILNSSVLNITVSKLTADAIGYLDYVTFNTRRFIKLNQQQFGFRDTRVISGPGTTAAYQLTNNSNVAPRIWEVTDPLNPKNQLYNTTGTQLDFVNTADSLKEFAVIGNSDFYTPTIFGKVTNQNLHGLQQADYVVVCHPSFLNQANKLAQFHQQADGLSFVVATTEQVYNEFSSGTPDIAAIREFTRMLYSRPANPAQKTKYLLLFGDGSYRNKDRFVVGNSAMIPTYQTVDSHSPIYSTVSDDYFGFMDDAEGDFKATDALDIGVGRFPVRNVGEAEGCVNKTIAYYRKNTSFDPAATESSCANNVVQYPQGDWRNYVSFVADDEENGTFMNYSDQLANLVSQNDKSYNLDKIYLDAYVQYSTPGGQRYPDAVNDLNRRFEKGSLIINYIGHGGELGLAHERILEVAQILDWRNIANMPLFVTATCEFSRFDDPERTSAGEYCLLNSQGGAIALFTTVRVAYAGPNQTLSQSLFQVALEPMSNGQMPALGDVFMLTKVHAGFSPYYLNFHLLGDPALKLSYPQQRVYTSTINTHTVTSTSSDTLRALAKVTITGYVGDQSGNKLTTFNGVVYPSVFDKSQNIVCLANDAASMFGGQPYQFALQKNILYKGKARVTNGDFSFTFMVPKDISYQYGIGKLSYYAHNGVMDAQGYSNQVMIGGADANAKPDDAGPEVRLYMNDAKFVSGGTTNETPNIYAEVADSSGINTLGSGIGHDIVAVLDDNTNKPIVLNDYYEANLNSYQQGKVKYPFTSLSEGNHRLSLKVWDVQNNSSTVYTDFVVAKSAELALSHILNYPNPFTTRTKFFIEHNQCCTTLKIVIQIYTITGKMVKAITQTVANEGYRYDGIEWDGKDEYGDKLARGVYVYKVSVTDGQNKKAEKIEKLVILN